MSQYICSQYVEVARCAKLVCGPLQFRLYPFLLGLGEERGKADNGGAQATQTDTHLVQCFRIPGSHPLVISNNLTKAVLRNNPEGVPGRHSRVKLKRPCLLKGRL